MFSLHPILQISGLVLAFCAFGLGAQRFRARHLGHRVAFQWKRHVLFGKLALGCWLAGLFWVMGLKFYHGGPIHLVGHGFTGLAMLPAGLVLFALGLSMNRPGAVRAGNQKSKALTHGALGCALLLWGLLQCIGGAGMYFGF